ncbi:hypothetical protein FBUS_01257 [Fasciolopsis buskii]|uniref:Uncharacterized protein n=1 Tax=Fasciolopsis buskii TaxID=27845 RepID=A0A8E0VFJ6_9TREM|nr:hypothetical protein FBUS_01257 [Fasciolopsis buski]
MTDNLWSHLTNGYNDNFQPIIVVQILNDLIYKQPTGVSTIYDALQSTIYECKKQFTSSNDQLDHGDPTERLSDQCHNPHTTINRLGTDPIRPRLRLRICGTGPLLELETTNSESFSSITDYEWTSE